jgi:murein L,D-transpeptidase YafK
LFILFHTLLVFWQDACLNICIIFETLSEKSRYPLNGAVMLKNFLFFLMVVTCCNLFSFAQGDGDLQAYVRSHGKVSDVFKRREDSLKADFQRKGLSYPAQDIYLRSFKQDEQLEVWVRNQPGEPFRFFKSYKVCAATGKLGPKRKEGDKQVPEGFYYINELNPNSHYHLSLGINYPNMSDKILSDSVRPGGAIYVHGDCVSVGCIAINDNQIEEVFMLAAMARSQGQEIIPIHIFPVKFSNTKNNTVVDKIIKDNPAYVPFLKAMQSAFYYFEKNRAVPPVLIARNGDYVTEDVPMFIQASMAVNEPNSKPVLKVNKHRHRKFGPDELAKYVEKQPQYTNGMESYNKFLSTLTNELSSYLDENNRRAFVYVEFVVDTDGSITNVNITKGGNEAMNDLIIERFEKMPKWTPAVKESKEVAYKMFQTVFVEVQTAQ